MGCGVFNACTGFIFASGKIAAGVLKDEFERETISAWFDTPKRGTGFGTWSRSDVGARYRSRDHIRPQHWQYRYSAAGIAVRLGYELRLSVVCAAAVVFCAGLELVQLAIPGRHARVSDFIVDSAAACTGIGIAWTVRRLTDGYLREGSSTAEPT